MLRVATPQFLPHFGIRAIPETAQVAGGLHGPLVRGEQRERDRDTLPADPRRLEALRRALPVAPLIAGSGVDAEIAAQFAEADAVIVGTASKKDGNVDAPIDFTRLSAIVKAFKQP